MLLRSAFLLLLCLPACGDDDKPASKDSDVAADADSDTAGDTGADTGGDTTSDSAIDTAAPDGDTTPAAMTVTLVFDEGGRDDNSFNFTALQGLERAETELGGFTPKEIDFQAEGLERGDAVELAAASSHLVICVGFSFGEVVPDIATSHPDVHFAIIDGEGPEIDNVSYHLYAANEGSFLVGAAAGLTTASKKIGFIGGVNIPVIDGFEAGFRAGVAHVAADAVVDTVHLSFIEDGDFSGFSNPEKAQEEALRMYGAGDDVIFHAAGGSGLGLFAAAAMFSDAGDDVWAIGVDTDQYLVVEESQRPYILTSVLKRTDVSVYNLVAALVKGEALPSGIVFGDLKAGLVGYATSGGHLAAIEDQLEALAEQIEAGTISVPSEL